MLERLWWVVSVSGDSVACKGARLLTLMLMTQPGHALSRPTRGNWCGLVFGEGDVVQVLVGVRCCGLGEEKGRCTELLVLEATHGRDASTSRGGHSEAPTSYVVVGLVPKWDESLFGTRTPRLTLTICLPMSQPSYYIFASSPFLLPRLRTYFRWVRLR